MPIEPGLRATAELTVTPDDTAEALGSGTVPVLGTPRVVALCEQAIVHALEEHLEPGTSTVGMRVQIDHLQPSVIGTPIEAEAVLETVKGRRLSFAVSASDPRGLVAAGRVTRVIVDVERFLENARQQGEESRR